MKKLLIFIFVAVFTNTLTSQSLVPFCLMCWVKATVSEDNTTSVIEWSRISSDSLDDGSAENYFAWAILGGMTAVKFPFVLHSYPINIIGGQIYVGDGSYPDGDQI